MSRQHISPQEIDDALENLVAFGLAEKQVLRGPDGRLETHYRLTDQGHEYARSLGDMAALDELMALPFPFRVVGPDGEDPLS